MFTFRQTKNIELEVSSYCNAACPQCPRNHHGGKTIEALPLTNWSMQQFNHIMDQFGKSPLELIYFCGTYGDPMMNPHILEMVTAIKNKFNNCRVGIHTNGGLQYHGLYKKLAPLVDFCAFGIDGLETTNHLYRRKVSWSKLQENVQAFIKAGGHAVWDYIVFEHNQHEVESARQMSMDLGFAEFNVKKTSRFINRKHQPTQHLDVWDDQGNIEYQLRLPTDESYINSSHQNIQSTDQKTFKHYLTTTKINCNGCRIKQIYIGSDGLVFPCGWLHDRIYCQDAQQHDDYHKLMAMYQNIGGMHKANAFQTDLEQIIDHTWFPAIEAEWPNNTIERCALMCGSKFNIIGAQNEDVDYKP